MSVTLKTFGVIGIALVGLVVYFSTFVGGLFFPPLHLIFYVGLALTAFNLIIISILAGGADV